MFANKFAQIKREAKKARDKEFGKTKQVNQQILAAHEERQQFNTFDRLHNHGKYKLREKAGRVLSFAQEDYQDKRNSMGGQ